MYVYLGPATRHHQQCNILVRPRQEDGPELSARNTFQHVVNFEGTGLQVPVTNVLVLMVFVMSTYSCLTCTFRYLSNTFLPQEFPALPGECLIKGRTIAPSLQATSLKPSEPVVAPEEYLVGMEKHPPFLALSRKPK